MLKNSSLSTKAENQPKKIIWMTDGISCYKIVKIVITCLPRNKIVQNIGFSEENDLFLTKE
jgi:hypothetical protein